MIHKVEQVTELREKLEYFSLASSFQLILVDQNIMVRKMLDSDLPSPPYHSPIFCTQLHELLPALKLSEKKPVVIWDMEQLSPEENIDRVLPVIKEKGGHCFLTSHNLDKARLVPLLQKGIAGFLLKPYTVEAALHKIKEKWT